MSSQATDIALTQILEDYADTAQHHVSNWSQRGHVYTIETKAQINAIIAQAIADELQAVAMDIKPYVQRGVTKDLLERVVELQG